MCSRPGQREGFAIGGALDLAAAFVRVAPGDDNELRLAIQWFGCALVGLALPLSAQTQACGRRRRGPDGEPWVRWGGHAVVIVGIRPGRLRPYRGVPSSG